MMLEYSFNFADLNNLLKMSINNLLSKGYRTADIYTDQGEKKLTTSEMGDLVIDELNKLKNEKI